MADYENSIETTLRDGTPVLIRQIRPEDKHYLELGMEHLSPKSRYFRFFTPQRELSEEQLKKFTEIDHHNHDAWGAVDISGIAPDPIGIARYIRLPDDPDAAELAVTVVDSHQGRGLGSLLMGIAASRAVDNDIKKFHTTELYENQPMFNLINGLSPTKHRAAGSEVELSIPLCENAKDYPKTIAGDIMRQADQLYHDACRSSAA